MPQQPVTQAVIAEETVEGFGQWEERGRRGQFNPEVAPAARHAIAVVGAGEVKAADDGRRVVDEEEFAVIAEGKVARREGIEDSGAAAGLFESAPVVSGQLGRPDAIDEDAHVDPTRGRTRERPAEAVPHLVVAPNIGLATDGNTRPFDQCEHASVSDFAGGQPARRRGREGRGGHGKHTGEACAGCGVGGFNPRHAAPRRCAYLCATERIFRRADRGP